MPEIVIVERSGKEHRISGQVGNSLMETIRDAGLDELLALCGGVCSCATCHVHVDPAWRETLAPISEDENDLLDSSSYRDDGSRLSCQVRLEAAHDGLRVRIAEED